MMAIGAGAKAIPAIVNYGENIGLRRQLRNLQNQPMPEYSVDPRINKLYEMGLADASNPEGYGGAAIGNFRRMLSRGMRGRFGNALSMGGGARGINAVLAGQEGDALGNFYAADANPYRPDAERFYRPFDNGVLSDNILIREVERPQHETRGIFERVRLTGQCLLTFRVLQ